MFARLVFTLVMLVIAGGIGYYYGYTAGSGHRAVSAPATVGTAGSKLAEDARAEGAVLEKKLTQASGQAGAFFSDATLTTKIKSKMGLDDHVDATAIHVSTSNGVVTLTGSVRSKAERTRAVTLARETNGVRSVVDRLEVK